MTVTLAQPRRIFSVEGDTLTDLVPTSAPTLGNTLIALVYAHSIDGNNVSFSQSTAPWTTVDTRYSGSAYVTVYVASLATQALLADSALTVTATNTDLLAVHLYEIEAPPHGFAFNFLSSRGNVSWHDSDNSEGTSASISFTGFPLLSGDIEMATLMMAGFSNPLSNTTTEPTIDSGFGGNIGPATEGVFASEFDSVMIESGMKTWEFDWTTSTDGIVMGIGLMVDRSGFARVQRKSSLTSSLTLDSTPVEGNLLFATVAVSDGEVPPNKAGWNRIVGAASTEGDRLCVFWREVVAGQGEEISFTVINGYGISVEEWDGFYGSPTVSGAATGGFIRDPSTGFGGYVAIIPALPLIDRIVVTSLLFTATPQEFMVIGDEGSRSFVGGQRVFSGADSTAVFSSYSPGFVGAYATNTETVLDADGLIIVFSDSSVVAPEITDPVPGDGPFVFPNAGQRLVYIPGERLGTPLLSTVGMGLEVFLDEACTTLATITDLDGELIEDSFLLIDENSAIPLFLGPVGANRLWIRIAGTLTSAPIDASLAEQIASGGGGGAVDSVNGQTGVVVLDADDIGDGTTNKAYTAAEQSKLAGIAAGATANQSDATTNAAIAAKATKVSITGATKTKVTFNADGIVTGGADATTADIADSSDKRYVTDAQRTVIGNTSGTNTGDQTLPTLSSLGAVPTSRTLAGLDLSADRTASALRTALGLVIGTDVLAPNGSGASLTGIPESAVTNLVTDLAAKAPLASPTFTGTPAAPTASAGTATTQVATTGFAVAASMFRPTAKIAPAYYAPIGTTVGGVTSPFSAAGVLGAAPIYLWAGSYTEVGNAYYYGTGTATIRIGLYDSTGTAGLAGSLVSGGDFGTISCVNGSSGSKSISISLTLATSGWYWIAGLCDAFTSAPQFSGYRTIDCSGPTMVPGFPHAGDTNRPSCILRTGVTTGSMPSTFGTPTNYQGTNFPAFRIYLNS